MEGKRHTVEDIESPFPTERNARYSAVLESHEDSPEDPMLMRWDVYRNGVHVGAGRLALVRVGVGRHGLRLVDVSREHLPAPEICDACVREAFAHDLLTYVGAPGPFPVFGPRW